MGRKSDSGLYEIELRFPTLCNEEYTLKVSLL